MGSHGPYLVCFWGWEAPTLPSAVLDSGVETHDLSRAVGWCLMLSGSPWISMVLPWWRDRVAGSFGRNLCDPSNVNVYACT